MDEIELAAANGLFTHGGYDEALADALYGTTDTMKDLKIDQISANSESFKLKVAGGFNFVYYFQRGTSAGETRYGLVQKTKNCKNDMGDNVMLSLCNCILAFQGQKLSGAATEFVSAKELTVHIVL